MHEIAEVVDDAFEEDDDFNLCPRCWISLLIKIVTKPLSWENAICKMTKMTETCISPPSSLQMPWMVKKKEKTR